MPILKDFRRVKIIKPEKYPNSEIEIYDSILAKDAMMEYDVNNIGQNIGLLAKFIKSWNFTDDKEIALEINKENVGLLDVSTLTYIAQEIKEFAIQVKKKD